MIALIRGSDDAAAAKAGLMAEPFEFTEVQAVDILDMQLRQRTRLSRIDLETELEDVRSRIRELEAILADDVKLRGVIKDELLAVKEEFATPRVSDRPRHRRHVDRGPRRRQGARRRDDRGAVRQGRPGRLVQDPVARRPRGQRGQAQGRRSRASRHLHDGPRPPAVLLQLRQGVPAARPGDPRARAHGQGHADRQPAAAAPGETIQAIIDTRDFAGERFLFFATRQGTVKKTAFDAYDSSRRDGLIALNLRDGDELVRVIETGGGDDIFMVSRKGMTIRFNEDDVRPMGRTAAGCAA